MGDRSRGRCGAHSEVAARGVWRYRAKSSQPVLGRRRKQLSHPGTCRGGTPYEIADPGVTVERRALQAPCGQQRSRCSRLGLDGVLDRPPVVELVGGIERAERSTEHHAPALVPRWVRRRPRAWPPRHGIPATCTCPRAGRGPGHRRPRRPRIDRGAEPGMARLAGHHDRELRAVRPLDPGTDGHRARGQRGVEMEAERHVGASRAPDEITAAAPSSVSSAGWNTARTSPGQVRPASARRVRGAPRHGRRDRTRASRRAPPTAPRVPPPAP